MNLNKVMLIGRLGKKPEVNYIKPDAPVARFSLATSETYKSKEGDKIETTEWHNIVAWRNNAKFAENYLDKGMLVYIEGKLQTRKWDAQDGGTRYTTEIVTDQIKILERKQSAGEFSQTSDKQNSNASEPAKVENQANDDVNDLGKIDDSYKSDIDDDLPF
ncbi:MAG TPA: single-stranded DNA-binding protein [Bacteroidales bacterium]|nr:single-stranded DNA-binding protein [Bacteroidales bacterium]